MTPVVVRHGCGLEVIRTPDGNFLEPLTHRLGIWRHDGSKLSGREIREGRGHRRHVCPPTEQLALIEGAGT